MGLFDSIYNNLFPIKQQGAFVANTNYPGGNTITNAMSGESNPPNLVATPSGLGLAQYGPFKAAGPTRPTSGGQVAGANISQQGQQGSQGSQGPQQGDVDAIYNPIRDFLNQMESEYSAGQPQAEADVAASYTRGLTPINEQEQTQLQSQNKQEGVVNTEEANALAQARQLYGELSQSGLAKYGTGSSAGGAVSELLGRQTAKQFGAIGQTATAGRTGIEEERGNIVKFAATKRTELSQQKEEAIRNVQKEFRQGMLQINGMKAQNESAKASARLELLQQTQQQAFQIEQADKAYARAIDQFEREKSATLQANAAFQSNQTLGGNTATSIQNVLNDPRYQTKVQKVTALASIPGVAGTPLFGQLISSIPADQQDENPFNGQ